MPICVGQISPRGVGQKTECQDREQGSVGQTGLFSEEKGGDPEISSAVVFGDHAVLEPKGKVKSQRNAVPRGHRKIPLLSSQGPQFKFGLILSDDLLGTGWYRLRIHELDVKIE